MKNDIDLDRRMVSSAELNSAVFSNVFY